MRSRREASGAGGGIENVDMSRMWTPGSGTVKPGGRRAGARSSHAVAPEEQPIRPFFLDHLDDERHRLDTNLLEHGVERL